MFPNYLTIINSPCTFPKDKAKLHVNAVTFFFLCHILWPVVMWNMTHAHWLTLSSSLTSVKVGSFPDPFRAARAASSSSHRLLLPPEGPLSALHSLLTTPNLANTTHSFASSDVLYCLSHHTRGISQGIYGITGATNDDVTAIRSDR